MAPIEWLLLAIWAAVVCAFFLFVYLAVRLGVKHALSDYRHEQQSIAEEHGSRSRP